MSEMKWFGPEPWDAPVNEMAERADIPAGKMCPACFKHIGRDDRGVVFVARAAQDGFIAYHLECFSKSILV